MKTLIIVLTIVIVDPYEGLDYEKINVYEIDKRPEKMIEVHYPSDRAEDESKENEDENCENCFNLSE